MPRVLDEAIAILRKAILNDDGNASATASSPSPTERKGNEPQAAAGNRASLLIEGNVKQAQILPSALSSICTRGSPEWLIAEDIVNYKEPA